MDAFSNFPNPADYFLFRTGITAEDAARRSRDIAEYVAEYVRNGSHSYSGEPLADRATIPSPEIYDPIVVINGLGGSGKSYFIKKARSYWTREFIDVPELSMVYPSIIKVCETLFENTWGERQDVGETLFNKARIPAPFQELAEKKVAEFRSMMHMVERAQTEMFDSSIVSLLKSVIRLESGYITVMEHDHPAVGLWRPKVENDSISFAMLRRGTKLEADLESYGWPYNPVSPEELSAALASGEIRPMSYPVGIYVNIREAEKIRRFVSAAHSLGLVCITLLIKDERETADPGRMEDATVMDYPYDIVVSNAHPKVVPDEGKSIFDQESLLDQSFFQKMLDITTFIYTGNQQRGVTGKEVFHNAVQ